MAYVYFPMRLFLSDNVWQTDVEPAPVDLVTVTVAQRYSILVTARNDTSSNWAIHANMDTDMFDTVPPQLNPSKYRTNPSHTPALTVQ